MTISRLILSLVLLLGVSTQSSSFWSPQSVHAQKVSEGLTLSLFNLTASEEIENGSMLQAGAQARLKMTASPYATVVLVAEPEPFDFGAYFASEDGSLLPDASLEDLNFALYHLDAQGEYETTFQVQPNEQATTHVQCFSITSDEVGVYLDQVSNIVSVTVVDVGLGIHMVKEDLSMPDYEGALDWLDVSWVRHNGLTLKPKSIEMVDFYYNNGTQIIANMPSGVIAASQDSSDGGSEITSAELTKFRDSITAVAQEFSHAVKIWQLDNELDMPGKWPSDLHWAKRGSNYAKYFKVMRDVVAEYAPQAKVMPFGLTGPGNWGSIFSKYFLNPLLASASPEEAAFGAFDIHYHTNASVDSVVMTLFPSVKSAAEAAVGHDVVLIATECSTWEGDPVASGQPLQTADDMASSFVRKQLCMHAAGVDVTCFGPLADRPEWKGVELHKFALNGLHDKQYTPKKVAYSRKRLTSLWLHDGWDSFAFEGVAGGVSATQSEKMVHVYGKNGTLLGTVIWSTSAGLWALPAGVDGAEVFDLVTYNEAIDVPDDTLGAAGSVYVQQQPVYVRYLYAE